MICYHCHTELIPLQDRPDMIFLLDGEVEPVKLKSCPYCGTEYETHMKETGMVIKERPQYRA